MWSPACVLVTGATSGLGKALALAILELPSKPKVIITGRRQNVLDELAAKSDRLVAKRLDQSIKATELRKWAQDLAKEHPELDSVILNAGIQHTIDWSRLEDLDITPLEEEVYTNYTSLLALSTGLLPHLVSVASSGKSASKPRLVNVTSGLACVPLPSRGNYCATKAAVHSLTMSMRYGMKDKGVQIVELLPPLVESELHTHQGNANDMLSKFWMPIEKFTEEAMNGLKEERDVVAVGNSAERYESFEQGKHKEVKDF